ncbi:META domain-containing protein [Ectopseudomonas toyotomiensis]|uniref:Heat shock protein HslJ n=1 Tax=Ectopseudomonas toyotomiensis TaxID=554344 RepID=A0A1I5QXB3_9GAMM|nr:MULTISPECIES: META domain-containing protein [Pseudomonas]AQZ34224.1 META domain-containing protein [Pseudomonas sp. LPH1]PIA74241.1 META domain-containing protein [Pseudomonas toyotomiensis]QSL91915.1 META domain-containing protein [Pseudomonas toyotomiensis]SFP50918.1 heat shock protein HslJ [Pseudomonas toyotomiensis]
MYRALPLALLTATLVGCASDAPQLETERSYQVEWIGESPLIDRSHLTVTFAADGRAHGHAGCNHWFAGYTLKDDAVRFETPGSTRKMCAPSLMEQEQRFLAALEEVQRWDFNDIGQLQLWPATGKPIRLWPE